MLLQQREADQDSCEERHDDGAQRSKERENASEKAIGSKEVGRAVKESNVMDSISVVVFDIGLMQESRQT